MVALVGQAILPADALSRASSRLKSRLAAKDWLPHKNLTQSRPVLKINGLVGSHRSEVRMPATRPGCNALSGPLNSLRPKRPLARDGHFVDDPDSEGIEWLIVARPVIKPCARRDRAAAGGSGSAPLAGAKRFLRANGSRNTRPPPDLSASWNRASISGYFSSASAKWPDTCHAADPTLTRRVLRQTAPTVAPARSLRSPAAPAPRACRLEARGARRKPGPLP
jgi:hypothetical protein